MKTFGKLTVGLMAALPLMLGSCTLSEPSAADGAADQYLLSSVSTFGIPVFKFSYDAQGRLVEATISNDATYTLEYSGNNRIPDSMMIEEYEEDEVWDENKDEWKEVSYMSSRITYSQIKGDESTGRITSWAVHDESFNYDGVNSVVENYTTTFTYDAAGHLTRESDSDGEWSAYDWQGGDLVRGYDDDTTSETATIAYTDVENITGQWPLELEFFGPLGNTGFFGTAPKHFPKSMTWHQSGNETDTKYLAYSLQKNGLIHYVKYTEDGETITETYNYVKK